MDDYSIDTSIHYKAYRPPLHHIILRRCLNDLFFNCALDVGCGVGISTVALTEFSKKVIGFDPSKQMLNEALSNECVQYISELKNLNFDYDLLCFFGSLFYINETSINQYISNLIDGGSVICCDFKIDYQAVLNILGLNSVKSNYNHQKNLDHYGNGRINQKKSEQFDTHFTCTTAELSHLLFSEHHLKPKLIAHLDSKHPFKEIINQLDNHLTSDKWTLKASCYFSVYLKGK